MDENLAGYLMNSLDSESHAEVEAYLAGNPEAVRRLELIRGVLQPLAADAEPEEPPTNLALRTLGLIARHQCQTRDQQPATLPAAPARKSSGGGLPGWGALRRIDVLVAACLLVVVAGLALPWLTGARARYQDVACKNNLHRFHESLVAYHDTNNGAFPKIERDPPRHVAGIFVPLLHDANLLPKDFSTACPTRDRTPAAPVSVRELEQLWQTDRPAFEEIARKLAGCYAYTLGYVDEAGAHRGHHRNELEDNVPLMADQPPAVGRSVIPDQNSPNHGGRGQNVLHVGGNVEFKTTPFRGAGDESIYLNHHKRVAAGRDRQDAVLGASWATPTGD